VTQKKYFDPPAEWTAENAAPHGSIDRRDGSVYVFHAPKLRLAVNVALVTGRPLFVRGGSGSGKSSLARSIARLMKRRYYENVISSRTQVRDLLWSVDELQRLRDARADKTLDISDYIQPGTLWWAFDAVGASKMGRAIDPTVIDWTDEKLSIEEKAKLPAVVLLDEIDKADPDLPNDLLVPLGSLRFDVPDIRPPHVVAPEETDPRRRLLIVITTNEEREMPPAFLRRCVVVTLPPPDEATLVRIAAAHFGSDEQARFEKIARSVVAASGRKPSAAEYLDTILASRDLTIPPDGGEEWSMLAELTLWKGSEG
jgi:MoxR-like ATPase